MEKENAKGERLEIGTEGKKGMKLLDLHPLPLDYWVRCDS